MSEGFDHKTFAPRGYLVTEGSPGEAAYLITSGKVEIRKGDRGDNPQTLAVLGKGEVVGEMALFDDSLHMAGAIALEETQAGAISRDEFQRRVSGMDPAVMPEVPEQCRSAPASRPGLQSGQLHADAGLAEGGETLVQHIASVECTPPERGHIACRVVLGHD